MTILLRTIHSVKCSGDVPTVVKERMIAGLQSQLRKYQWNRPVANSDPIHPRPGAPSKNGLTSNRGSNRPTRKVEVRICRSKYWLVRRIARGRRYRVVSDSKKHHSLWPNVRGLPPKEKESYQDNGNFKYHKAYTYPLPQLHKQWYWWFTTRGKPPWGWSSVWHLS